MSVPTSAPLAVLLLTVTPSAERRRAQPRVRPFGGDAGGNLVAWHAVTGTPVWHTHLGDVTNPPMTYMLDGRQYLLVAATDTLYAFALYQ